MQVYENDFKQAVIIADLFKTYGIGMVNAIAQSLIEKGHWHEIKKQLELRDESRRFLTKEAFDHDGMKASEVLNLIKNIPPVPPIPTKK